MNTGTILDDIYNNNLKSIDQLKVEAQNKEAAVLKKELRWEEIRKEEGVQQVLSTLSHNLQESHEMLLAMALNQEVSDSQIRNHLVRYSTLYRTKNAVTHNNEII